MGFSTFEELASLVLDTHYLPTRWHKEMVYSLLQTISPLPVNTDSIEDVIWTTTGPQI